MKFRDWQARFFSKWSMSTSDMLVEAGVGAGKTSAAGAAAQASIKAGESTFVLVVVPTKELKSSFQATFKLFRLELTTVLKDGHGRPKEYDGAAVTYSQLKNLSSTLEAWKSVGERVLLILDEVHHCASGEHANEWGAAAENARRSATRCLALSGTPFRTDGRRISFVEYDADGRALPDVKYTYEQSVADGVCRAVTFLHDDGIAKYALDGVLHERRLSETDDKDRGLVAATAYSPRSEFMEKLIAKTERRLEDLRATDPTAACLVICRPGTDDASSDRHVNKLAQRIAELTGETPVVVTCQDKDAAAKIEAFRKGRQKYIVSVRMISEGIDIPRLRVLLMANTTDSEMLFRQMVGRVVRQTPDVDPEDAYVVMAKLPPMSDFADRMLEEAVSGVRKREEKARDAAEQDKKAAREFQVVDCGHEDGGAMSLWASFSEGEVARAEAAKASDPALRRMKLTDILHAWRALGHTVEPTPTEEPLQVRKKRKQTTLNLRVRRLAVVRNGMTKHSTIWVTLFSRLGVKDMRDLVDNHAESKLDDAIAMVEGWIAKETDGG